MVAVGVGVSVAVAAAVAVAVAVPVAPPRTMMTYCSSPKKVPLAVDMRQFPRTAPVLFVGAVMATESSISVPGLTAAPKTRVVPLMTSPLVKANLKPASQVQLPVFLTRQVLVKVWPGVMGVLSGMVTSRTPVRP